MSFQPVPDGHLAAVVTYLEMVDCPAAQPTDSTLSLRRIQSPAPDEYRRLFRLVGERWLWFSRLAMDDAELAAIIRHPRVEIFVVIGPAGEDSGLIELDFRNAGECELAFIGLVPELAGQGHGRWLLAEAVRLAWGEEITRVRVHTCTLDHPAALAAYRRAGFTAGKRAVEHFPDPRLTGILPMDAAPQVPVVGTPASASTAPDPVS